MDPSTAAGIYDRSKELNQASIAQNIVDRPQTIQRFTLKLDQAVLPENAYVVNFPFKSFFVEGASDPSALVFMRPNTRDDMQSWFKAGYRDSWGVDYPVAKAFIHWPAQPGKTVDLVFFADSEFRSGSQVSLTSGGVSISEGTSFTVTNPTFAANTATQILASNALRKTAVVTNRTMASLYVGPAASVTASGATRGFEIPAGGSFEWKNTAAIFGICGVAADLNILEET